MVAYTTPDCLPYYTASDPLCLNTGTVCDEHTVWCDFAELVEAQLTAFDEVVDRAATSVPMAWIETTTPFTFSPGGSSLAVPFDTVRVDTDNMADLDANASALTVTRSGLYQLTAYGTATWDRVGAGTGAARMTVFILPFLLNMGQATASNYSSNRATYLDLETVSPALQVVVPMMAGQQAIANISGSGVSTDVATYSKAMMALTWVGDLP